MLKKLIKYGNSNALVLDKAIMELLDIQEQSLVKLKIEGNSLVITPAAQTVDAAKVSMTGQEKLFHVLEERKKTMDKTVESDLEKQEFMKHWKPGNPTWDAYQKEFMAIAARYSDELHAFQKTVTQSAWQQGLDALAAKHQGHVTSQEYLDDFFALRYQLVPRLKEMDEELKQLQQKLNLPSWLS